MTENHRQSRFWLKVGLAAGVGTALAVWLRRRHLASLPDVAPDTDRADLALITGASSGIGMRYAIHLARQGYDVVLVARREQRLRVLATELERTYGVRAKVLVADLSTPEGVAQVERRIEASDRLDFLVNNAGFSTEGHYAEADFDAQHAMLAVHVLAPIRFMRAALPSMLARGRGAVVNVSSLMAFYPLPGQVMYSATKAYLVSFSEALHGELIGDGVRVQALCPGFTRTEMHADAPRGWLANRIWMPPDAVVTCSLRDLKRDRVISVPGVGYRALVVLSRLLPRPLVHLVGRLAGEVQTQPAGAEGEMAGFAKRTYQGFDEVLDDIRYMREHSDQIREAMRLIDSAFRERLMLAVTQVNGCRYCAQYHAKVALEEGLDQTEVTQLLTGDLVDAPPEQRTALLYAQHWADQRGAPDPQARARLVEVYGAQKAEAIDVLLQMIKMGNYVGNAWDYVLYRVSGGRMGKGEFETKNDK